MKPPHLFYGEGYGVKNIRHTRKLCASIKLARPAVPWTLNPVFKNMVSYEKKKVGSTLDELKLSSTWL